MSFSPIQVANSRVQVVTRGDRAIMVANDWMLLGGNAGYSERHNVALFFNQTRGFDFVAGNSVTGMDGLQHIAHYPQIAFNGDKAAVIYSYCASTNCGPGESGTVQSIKVAEVDGLPASDKHYIYPRYGHKYYWSSSVPLVTRDSVFANHLKFYGDISSAGLEVPTNDPTTDDLRIHFRFKVFSGDKVTLMSTGTPNNAVKVFAREWYGGRWIEAKTWPSEDIQFCGIYSTDWTDIDVVTGHGRAEVSVNGGAPCAVAHSPEMNTVYLGESFFSTAMQPTDTDQFQVDLNSVRTSVVHDGFAPWRSGSGPQVFGASDDRRPYVPMSLCVSVRAPGHLTVRRVGHRPTGRTVATLFGELRGRDPFRKRIRPAFDK